MDALAVFALSALTFLVLGCLARVARDGGGGLARAGDAGSGVTPLKVRVRPKTPSGTPRARARASPRPKSPTNHEAVKVLAALARAVDGLDEVHALQLARDVSGVSQ